MTIFTNPEWDVLYLNGLRKAVRRIAGTKGDCPISRVEFKNLMIAKKILVETKAGDVNSFSTELFSDLVSTLTLGLKSYDQLKEKWRETLFFYENVFKKYNDETNDIVIKFDSEGTAWIADKSKLNMSKNKSNEWDAPNLFSDENIGGVWLCLSKSELDEIKAAYIVNTIHEKNYDDYSLVVDYYDFSAPSRNAVKTSMLSDDNELVIEMSKPEDLLDTLNSMKLVLLEDVVDSELPKK